MKHLSIRCKGRSRPKAAGPDQGCVTVGNAYTQLLARSLGMPSFTCSCGFSCRDDKAQSGVLFRLTALAELETRIAREVAEFLAAEVDRKESIVRARLGKEYPPSLGDVEVVEDIVAQLINESRFRSVFECPNCGKIALADSDGNWTFYSR